MENLRKLIGTVLLSGFAAGLLLFVLQHFTTFPLIQQAEVYESAAEHTAPHADHDAHHGDADWQPGEGTERTSYTVLTTVLVAIGFSALLFGLASFASVSLNWRRGALLGDSSVPLHRSRTCMGTSAAAAGTVVADLSARQLWWVGTAIATACGLWLSVGRGKSILRRLTGVIVMLVPHAIGAPVATGQNAVPVDLMHRFAAASVFTTGIFWIALGLIGGFFYQRFRVVDQMSVDLK